MDRPRLVETGRGPTVQFKGRFLYSAHSPTDRPERIARGALVFEQCLYVVPSPLMGYGMSILAERIPESSHILALETSQDIFALCSPNLPEDLLQHPKITWARLSDSTTLHVLFRQIGPWRFRRVHRLDLSGGEWTSRETYGELIHFLTVDMATYWRNRHALGRLGRHWVRHLYANLADLAKGVVVPDKLKVTGVPAVIGAGPSLENNLPFIQEHRDKLWVMAADTAVGTLRDTGINPDVIVVLETQPWNLLDLHGTQGIKVPILGDLTAYPLSLHLTGGGCHLFSSTFADLEVLSRAEKAGVRPAAIPPLGSVGLAAIELALKYTSGPVLLMGLDFAYQPGKTHARGSSVHRWQLSQNNRLDPLPGWKSTMNRSRTTTWNALGQRITTDTVLEGYAALLRDRHAGSKRLFVLEPGGLDFGVPLIDQKKAVDILKSHTPIGQPHATFGEFGKPDSAAAKAFLDAERDSLEAVIHAWNEYARDQIDSWAVVKKLQGMDQLYCDFPDEPPLPKNDDAFLVRAVRRSQELKRLLDRLLKSTCLPHQF